jgi:DNA-directed RNA polymerase specialized sigma24 family protein
VSEENLLVERFEQHRARLTVMAYRMVGSPGSEHAVQETWVQLSQSGADDVEDLDRWLRTELARVCLQILRARTPHLDVEPPAVARHDGAPDDGGSAADPAYDALPVVLRTLSPAERVAFALHDLSEVPIEEVARILGRTPTAARQLAGRARRRVQSPDRTLEADRTVHGRVVDAFLRAAPTEDLDELVWLLHPDAALHADAAVHPDAVHPDALHADVAGVHSVAIGAQAVAETFARHAKGTRPATLDGFPAAVQSVDGRTTVVAFTVTDGRIAEIELITDPEVVARLDLGSAPS